MAPGSCTAHRIPAAIGSGHDSIRANPPSSKCELNSLSGSANSSAECFCAVAAPSIYTNFQVNTVGNMRSHQFSVGSIGLRLSLASFGATSAAGAYPCGPRGRMCEMNPHLLDDWMGASPLTVIDVAIGYS
jgi:hypothetical protein